MTKYVARIDGQIVGNRTTQNRIYTHAIVVNGHSHTNHVAAWSSSLRLAQDQQRKWSRFGYRTDIVPAEMVAPNKSPMKQITWSDDTWNIAGRGVERDGKVYLHLSSATRVQRDGRCPVQICDWVPAELIA